MIYASDIMRSNNGIVEEEMSWPHCQGHPPQCQGHLVYSSVHWNIYNLSILLGVYLVSGKHIHYTYTRQETFIITSSVINKSTGICIWPFNNYTILIKDHLCVPWGKEDLKNDLKPRYRSSWLRNITFIDIFHSLPTWGLIKCNLYPKVMSN